jgi:small GTP-binding protein
VAGAVPGLGVPQLERLVGPVPEHAALLFLNDPGIEAEPFLYQAAHHHLAAGGSVVYAITNRSPSTVLAGMDGFGLDVHEARGRLHFLDAYSGLMGAASQAEYLVHQPHDPARVVEALERAAREHPDALLVVDSLSSFLDQGQERAIALFPRVLDAMRRFRMSEALFTRWPYPPEVQDLLGRFDAVVGLRAVEERVTLSQYFRVERLAWRQDVDARPRLYKSLRPGGVHVYIPKILVTGPYGAGKSAFVQSVSDSAVSVDHLGTTVALDHGRVTMDGLTADVFGTAGQARFDPLLRVVAGQALGVVVVVDSTQPDTFPRAREMMNLTWRQGLPAIIAANKQDLPGALLPDEVARMMDLPAQVRVVGCRGNDRASGRDVLRALIDQILFQGATA